MIDHHPHISDIRWDRLLAGEAPDDDAASHAAACSACAARWRELLERRNAFAARPPLVAVARTRRRARPRAWLAWAGALAAAVALVLVRLRPDDVSERAKGVGGPELILAVGRPGGPLPLASGDEIYPGDTLQAGYSSEQDGFGAVLAIDGSGTTLRYVPSRGDAMVALPAGRECSFPASTVLDQVTGSERVAIAWCNAARPLAPMLSQLETTGSIDAPPGCVVRLVVLHKRVPP